LRWTPEAIDDLDRIDRFNRSRSDAWAERVETRLIERTRTLVTRPNQGRQGLSGSVRLLSLPDIQYVITYRIEDDTVWIVRVHHTCENRERQ
jgi:plasmid stabilization system protein ParE